MSRLAALGESDGRRMKFLNPPALALAALFSVVFSLPFLPAARMRTDRVVPRLGETWLRPRNTIGYALAMTDPKLSDVGAVMWQHVPFSVIQHRALSQGELPLWNRYNALGVP
ncbi:MAG: hypothetical protein ACKOTE_15050, partial [Opitutaceae bacterium]